jgi:hypothetical protein
MAVFCSNVNSAKVVTVSGIDSNYYEAKFTMQVGLPFGTNVNG